MKYFSFLTTLVRLEKLLVIICLISLLLISWKNIQIKNQAANQQVTIQANLEKELLDKIQKLPELITLPPTKTTLNQYDIFTLPLSASNSREVK